MGWRLMRLILHANTQAKADRAGRGCSVWKKFVFFVCFIFFDCVLALAVQTSERKIKVHEVKGVMIINAVCALNYSAFGLV